MFNDAGIATEVEKRLSLRAYGTSTNNYNRTRAISQRAVWLGCKYVVG